MTEITNYITNDFKAIESQENISAVQEFFNQSTFSHFPVIEEEIYLGCIASNDVETFESHKKVFDYRYSLEGFFARNTMVWLEVLEVFAKNNTNLIPVLDEKNRYIGYYEIGDIMNFFNETPFLSERGKIIVVKKREIDYSVSQITQIVESNNGKLLGLFVSATDVENIEITLKISIGPVNEIIQAFRRYNYEILSDHNEDSYISTLKERSDYLTKYLNI